MTKVTQLNVGPEGGGSRRRIHLREISGDSEAPLETVGQDLRAARLRRGEDLATVSRALKIRKDHLDAVEADDIARLPGKTYAIGFVRTYAAYLGLDAVETVERFKQEIAGRQDVHTLSSPSIDYEGRRLPYGWRIVAGIVILCLAYGAWHLLSGGPSSQPVPPPPVLNAPHAAAPAADKAATPPPAAAQTAPAQTTPVQTASVQTAPVQAPPPQIRPAAGPVADAKPGNVAAAATADAAMPDASASANAGAPAGAGHVYGARNKSSRITLHAKADTRVEVRGPDGTVWINRNLSAGDQYYVPNIPGLTLTASNAGAVVVDVDGKAMGAAGADQQAADNLNIDPQAIMDRSGNR